MYSASVIAYAFVKRGINDGSPVTQMKVQKLVFFAHGLHLALYGKPLIKEQFQAWKFGPVVPSIYQDYKLYGADPILTTDYIALTKSEKEKEEFDTVLDGLADYVIKNTWSVLKNTDAVSLSAWTHKEGSPWQKFYKQGVSDIIIPNEEIEAYFKKEFVKST